MYCRHVLHWSNERAEEASGMSQLADHSIRDLLRDAWDLLKSALGRKSFSGLSSS